MKIALLISCAMISGAMTQAKVRTTSHPHGIDPANFDLKAKPGTDFFQYACGGWNKRNPMPADQSRWGVFNQLIDNNNKRIKELIEEMSAKKSSDSLEQKIGLLYNKVIDQKTLNAQGIKPLLVYTDKIAQINSREGIQQAAAAMGRYGVSAFFTYGTEADAMDSKMNLVSIGQGGLTLGQRDYYLDTDTATLKIRKAYKEFGQQVLSKIYSSETTDQIAKRMNGVLQLETRLAKSFKSRVELRVPENNYQKISYQALKDSYKTVDWDQFFRINKYPAFDYVNVGQPDALSEANEILANEDLEVLKSYLTLRLAVNSLPYLSDELRGLHFGFFGRVMSGTEQEQPAWKRGVNLENELLGEALGRIYVKRYFPEAAKKRMETLVSNLQKALGERIKAQDWMSDETKAKALEKLSTFYVKIGYPNKWRDFSGLQLDPDKSLLETIMTIMSFNSDYYTEKTVGKPVDRDQWYMNPHEVNAYYNPPTNEICFPAGILQYPFFDMEADDAFNYGAIGVVIGHEMTHGFDDQGRKFDKDGNMKEWWTPEDAKRFQGRTQVMVDYFNKIKVLPDLNANGQLTLGENLADHGGLQVSFTALQNATKGQPSKRISGYTPEQRFFLAFAGVWAGTIRDAEIRKRVKSDPHSLAKWRVDGQLPHIDAWYKAFNITPKDPLYVPKDKRVTIW